MATKKITPYNLYADAVKKADHLRRLQLPALNGWLDPAGKEIPGEEADQQRRKWEVLREATYKAEVDAETILVQHLKPFEKAADALTDDAFYRRKNITKYKNARQRLWNEQQKMKNAVLKMRGEKPRKMDRSNYHLDFE